MELKGNNKSHIFLIHSLMQKIKYFCKTYNIKTLFIVGDFCRERYLGKLVNVKEIEIFNAYPDYSRIVASLFATEILGVNPEISNEYQDLRIEYKSKNKDSINLVFKSGILPGYINNISIQEWFTVNNVEETPLNHYLYSKNFTINTLVYSFKTNKMHDVLNRAIKDFNSKKIVSIFPANLLIKNDPIAILNAIQFSLKYDFVIDDELKNEMRDKTELLLKHYTTDRIVNEIIRILQVGKKAGFTAIQEYGLSGLLTNSSVREYLDKSMENNDAK